MGTYIKIIITGISFSLLLLGTRVSTTTAQKAQLHLDLQLNEALANSQVINVNNILLSERKDVTIYNLFLQNENPTEPARDLYFNLRFHSDKRGLLANIYQRQGQPFSLEPGQQIYATNNDLSDGLPGVKERIVFDGGLTKAGERFLNRMNGSAKLPPGRYVVQVDIFQGGNSRNGGVWIASVEADLGGNAKASASGYDIFLTSPGGAVGTSEMEITNPYPEFRWEGSSGANYRLVVVEAKDRESPESLIQGALSTAPVKGNGNSGKGTLLDYEIVDVSLKKPNYQFPPSGVQALKQGEVYYWQVLTELSTSNGPEQRASEIWSFTMAEQEDRQLQKVNGEVRRVLSQLLDGNVVDQLRRAGYQFQSVEIDGEVISGPMALERLLELMERADGGEITIVKN